MVIGAMGGAASIAYYTIPYNVAAPLTLISHSLTVALFPRLAATSSANARCISADATRNLVAVMTPIVIGALAVAHPFLALWVGQEFAASANGVSELILLGVWTNSTVVAHFSRLQATGRVKTIFFTYLIEIPIYFLFLWVGLRTWGVLGAAAAWSLRVLLDAVLLLSVGGAFWQTVKDTFPAMALVVTSWGLVTFVDFYSPLRWVGLLILMALSMALNFPLIKRVSALAFSR
jgi:O-antigen/teichoic acid export membrane protein